MKPAALEGLDAIVFTGGIGENSPEVCEKVCDRLGWLGVVFDNAAKWAGGCCLSVAHVIREGAESEIPAAELVPGDLVVLAAGARVPADGRIVESARLQIEEAALTGESLAVKLMMCDRRFAKSVRFGNPRRSNRRATRPATVGRIRMMRQRVMPV